MCRQTPKNASDLSTAPRSQKSQHWWDSRLPFWHITCVPKMTVVAQLLCCVSFPAWLTSWLPCTCYPMGVPRRTANSTNYSWEWRGRSQEMYMKCQAFLTRVDVWPFRLTAGFTRFCSKSTKYRASSSICQRGELSPYHVQVTSDEGLWAHTDTVCPMEHNWCGCLPPDVSKRLTPKGETHNRPTQAGR